jgi:putative lipoic acid-binding regulatory protein
MFGILVALEAFKASKEVLVRRPAPPGIRPFLENKRSIQGRYVSVYVFVDA